MNTTLLDWLISSGLDEKRAAIYLAALARGEATAADLAKDLKMTRTTIYDHLRVLEDRGYVQMLRKGKRGVIVPLHPKELLKRAERTKAELSDLLPNFLALYAGEGKRPSVQTFMGAHAAREVFEDILKVCKKEYVYFSAPSETFRTVEKAFIKKWIARRVAKGIASRSLRSKTKGIVDPFFLEERAHLRQIRYLPAYVDLKSSIYLYENRIGVISTQAEGGAYIIHSPDLAFSLRQIFEFLWGISLG